MDASSLVERIARLQVDRQPSDHLRMALLVLLHHPLAVGQGEGGVAFRADDSLREACQKLSWQLAAATDQHAAVADELDSLASTVPSDFTPDHLWTLIRTIKIQSQILNMYLGPDHALAPTSDDGTC